MNVSDLPHQVITAIRSGLVIPAHPLALNPQRRLDVRRQRALTRYYLDAGAGGLALGVHTTQFAIRNPGIDLLQPVLSLAAETINDWSSRQARTVVRIAGLCGSTSQAAFEAALAVELGYHAGLLSLAALPLATEDELIAHCREVARIIPIFGFYLQPAVGGRPLPYTFWRRFTEIDNVLAIKIAPFNRYQTLDVLRAVADSGRAADIPLYTGNDDHILLDLLTPHRFTPDPVTPPLRIVGGLLGQWAVWTQQAVSLLHSIHRLNHESAIIPPDLLTVASQLTDLNAAVFDAVHQFRGCIPGIHEVLRRQGLLEGVWCLNPAESLSPGQALEIDRVSRAYPHLVDDKFVRQNLDGWLSD